MELAEALSKVLGRPVDTACNLIEALLGEPFKIAGDALADHVRLWQWKNRLRIVDRAEEIMRQRGIHRRAVNPDFLLPFIRDCGDTSAETLQEAWARLLSAAVEDDSNEHIALVNTLRNLTASDVQVANCLIELGYLEREHRVPAISDRLGLPRDRVELSIHNLEHLGFFTPTQRGLKGFAVRFLRACVANTEALDKYLESQKAAKRKVVFD
jgi:predicted transcriptional regulator